MKSTMERIEEHTVHFDCQIPLMTVGVKVMATHPSASDAIELAIKVQKRDYPCDIDRDWQLASAAIMPVSPTDGKWVWLVSFHNVSTRSVGQTEILRIAVDMDGGTVGPSDQ